MTFAIPPAHDNSGGPEYFDLNEVKHDRARHDSLSAGQAVEVVVGLDVRLALLPVGHRAFSSLIDLDVAAHRLLAKNRSFSAVKC